MRRYLKLGNILAVLLVGTVVVAGCTIATIGGRGAVPIVLNQFGREVKLIKHVVVSKSVYFDYTASYDASSILAKIIEETGADAVINVSIRIKVTVPDYLINVLTLGLANGKTVEIEADAVKFVGGRSSLLLSPGIKIMAEARDLFPIVSKIIQGVPQFDKAYGIIVLRETDKVSKYTLIQYLAREPAS